MTEIDEVKEWFLNEVVPIVLKNGKFKDSFKNIESFKVIDVSINPIGLDEAFMLTKCYRIKLDYEYESVKETCHLVAKKTPNDILPENLEAMGFKTLFHNEIAAYNTIVPAFIEFSKMDEKDFSCPKYYYSKEEESEASIVLGDFGKDGFRLAKERYNLSLEHIILSVEHLGFFHGLGFGLKAVNRHKFDTLVSLAKESRYDKTQPEPWNVLNDVTQLRVTTAVEQQNVQIPKQFLKNLETILLDLFNFSKKRVQPIEPYATLCHGDYLRNNIAFAYDDKDKPSVPTRVMMFDFQTLRYSSPMVDLSTILSLSAGKDVRTKHFEKIFDAYYHKLTSSFVEYSKQELPEFLSRSSLLKEYVRYLPFSLSIASFFLGNVYEPNNMFTDMMSVENIDIDKFKRDYLALGGEAVVVEIASLVKELYDFTVQEDIDVFEGFV